MTMKGKYRYMSLITISMLLAILFASVALDSIKDNAQEGGEGILGIQNGTDPGTESCIPISSATTTINGPMVNVLSVPSGTEKAALSMTLADGDAEKDGDPGFELNLNLLVLVIIAIIIAIGGTASYTLKK
jgi:hypothetical protein